jgi:dTDP-4-dehydrorhamnose reductase
MNILITGSHGQLAAEFQKSLRGQNYTVTALDKHELDITDMTAVSDTVSRISPDVIVNCAAYNYVDNAEDDFDSAFKVNAFGVRNLAVSCREHSVLLIHFSSDYVFDQ